MNKIKLIIFALILVNAQDARAKSRERLPGSGQSQEEDGTEGGSEAVEYCSTSKVQLDTYTVDYAWTVNGILGYLVDIQKRDLHPMTLTLANLKFNDQNLRGVWSISLQQNNDLSVVIAFMYTTPSRIYESKIKSMVGELWLSTGPPQFAKSVNLHRAFAKTFDGSEMVTFHELKWHDHGLIQQVVEQFKNWNRRQNLNISGQQNQKEHPDEINFILHVKVQVQNLRSEKLGNECTIGDAKSQRKIDRDEKVKRNQKITDKRLEDISTLFSDSKH